MSTSLTIQLVGSILEISFNFMIEKIGARQKDNMLKKNQEETDRLNELNDNIEEYIEFKNSNKITKNTKVLPDSIVDTYINIVNVYSKFNQAPLKYREKIKEVYNLINELQSLKTKFSAIFEKSKYDSQLIDYLKKIFDEEQSGNIFNVTNSEIQLYIREKKNMLKQEQLKWPHRVICFVAASNFVYNIISFFNFSKELELKRAEVERAANAIWKKNAEALIEYMEQYTSLSNYEKGQLKMMPSEVLKSVINVNYNNDVRNVIFKKSSLLADVVSPFFEKISYDYGNILQSQLLQLSKVYTNSNNYADIFNNIENTIVNENYDIYNITQEANDNEPFTPTIVRDECLELRQQYFDKINQNVYKLSNDAGYNPFLQNVCKNNTYKNCLNDLEADKKTYTCLHRNITPNEEALKILGTHSLNFNMIHDYAQSLHAEHNTINVLISFAVLLYFSMKK